jgi:hypothetical protein
VVLGSRIKKSRLSRDIIQHSQYTTIQTRPQPIKSG